MSVSAGMSVSVILYLKGPEPLAWHTDIQQMNERLGDNLVFLVRTVPGSVMGYGGRWGSRDPVFVVVVLRSC